MVHHDLEILFSREVDQFLALRGVAGEWLLNEYVLAVLQRGFRQLVVRPDRSDDGDGVDLGRRDHLRGVRSHLDSGISLLRALSRGWADLRDCEHLGTLQTREVPDDVWSPIAVTNHTEVHDVSPPSKAADDCERMHWGEREAGARVERMHVLTEIEQECSDAELNMRRRP